MFKGIYLIVMVTPELPKPVVVTSVGFFTQKRDAKMVIHDIRMRDTLHPLAEYYPLKLRQIPFTRNSYKPKP